MVLNSGTVVDDKGERYWSAEFLEKLPLQSQKVIKEFAGGNFTTGSPWYVNYVEMAKNASFIGKYEFEDEYTKPLTRDKAASIAVEFSGLYDGYIQQDYAEIAATTFKDYITFSLPYSISVGKAAILGLVNGKPDGSFAPKGYITRAEALTVIARIHDKSLRRPAKIDLSPYPFRVVPGTDGYPDMVNIFSDHTATRIYDDLIASQKLSKGLAIHKFTSITFYENEKMMKKHLERLEEPQFWYLREVFYDMSIGISINTYSRKNEYGFVITTDEGRLERHSDVLDAFLKSIFNKEAPEVKKFIDEHINKIRKADYLRNYDEEKVFGNYDVLLIYDSSGTKYINVKIRSK